MEIPGLRYDKKKYERTYLNHHHIFQYLLDFTDKYDLRKYIKVCFKVGLLKDAADGRFTDKVFVLRVSKIRTNLFKISEYPFVQKCMYMTKNIINETYIQYSKHGLITI